MIFEEFLTIIYWSSICINIFKLGKIKFPGICQFSLSRSWYPVIVQIVQKWNYKSNKGYHPDIALNCIIITL